MYKLMGNYVNFNGVGTQINGITTLDGCMDQCGSNCLSAEWAPSIPECFIYTGTFNDVNPVADTRYFWYEKLRCPLKCIMGIIA